MTTRRPLVALGIAALCVLAYAPGLTSPFTQYDDSLYVTDNLKMLTPSGWAGLALQWDSSRAWSGTFVEYFPLRDSVYWLIYQLFGMNPTPFHVTSLLFHIFATLLLWQLLGRLGLEARAALFATVLFALHPVHIESVVWIAGLKDPMYVSFMLLGLNAYAKYRQTPNVGSYALMLFGLVAALLVKSLAIVMPVLMLGMELLIGPRAPWKLIAQRIAGPAIITGQFLATFIAIGKANIVLMPLHGGSRMAHTVLMMWSQAKYLKQALLPTSFRMIYCFDPPTGWSDWRLWVGVAVVVGIGALAWLWRRDPLRLFFVGWYVVAMLPVSNLVPFPAIMADRYLYAPSIGSCVVLGLLAARLDTRLFRVVLVASVLGLTTTTASRSWVWQDEENLWEEPDLDPACVTDPAFPPAQGHVMRFRSAKNRHDGMMALERALMSPGLKNTGEPMICTTIISAAGEAAALGEPERAVSWTKIANRLCPNDARGWNIAMILNLHKNPPVAAMAATKAYRLKRSPEAEVMMWLARLELGDAQAPAEVLRLSTNPGACHKILQWAIDAPELAPRFAEAAERCLVTLRGMGPLDAGELY